MLTLSVRGCGGGPLPYLLATGKRTFHGNRKELKKQEGATCKMAVLRRSLVLVGFWRFFLAEKTRYFRKKMAKSAFVGAIDVSTFGVTALGQSAISGSAIEFFGRHHPPKQLHY